VWSQDGEEGTLTQLVVDAADLKLSALGIRLPGLFSHVAYMPFTFVEHVNDQKIVLACSHDQVKEETHPGVEGVVIDKRSSVSRKEESVRGNLYLLAVEPQTGNLRYLVVQHVRIHLLRIDARYIERVDPGRIRLAGIDQSWSQAIGYYPDEELQQRVTDSLYSNTSLHVDWDGIEMRVEEGIVTLWGNISSSLRSDMVTNLVSSTEGVHEVRNHLLGDDDLANDLSYQLSHVPELHELSLGLYPTLGTVRVSGTVANEAQKETIMKLIRSTRGVRGVTDDLHVGTRVGEIRAMSPVPKGNDEDLVPGPYIRHAKWRR
jgi:osmotically-inducible protein OsmY